MPAPAVMRRLVPPSPPTASAVSGEANLPPDGRACPTCKALFGMKMRFDSRTQRYVRFYWCPACKRSEA